MIIVGLDKYSGILPLLPDPEELDMSSFSEAFTDSSIV